MFRLWSARSDVTRFGGWNADSCGYLCDCDSMAPDGPLLSWDRSGCPISRALFAQEVGPLTFPL
jgi:hypothetical protein